MIKITGNSSTYHKMIDDIDINAGEVMDGNVSLEQMGDQIYQMLLSVCSGAQTKAESLGHDELFGIGRYECY